MCSEGISVSKEMADSGSSDPDNAAADAIASHPEASAVCEERYRPHYGVLLNIIISKLEELIIRKQNELDVSKECLKIAEKRNETIKQTVHAKVDQGLPQEFYNKVLELNETDDKELMALHKKIEDMAAAYEAAQAEKLQMERLLQELSKRSQFADVEVEAETSKDVPYLQERIHNLEMELTALRKAQQDGALDALKEEQSKIVEVEEKMEQDGALDTLKEDLEKECKITEVEEKMEQDGALDTLKEDLEKQCKITEVEEKMHRMHAHYRDVIDKLRADQKEVENQAQDLETELMRTKTKALQVKCLEQENERLLLELRNHDRLLSNLRKQSTCLPKQLAKKDCQFQPETDSDHEK